MDDLEFDARLRRSNALTMMFDEIVAAAAEVNAATLILLVARDIITADQAGYVLDEVEFSFRSERTGSWSRELARASRSIFDRYAQGAYENALRQLLLDCAAIGRTLRAPPAEDR